MGRIKLFDCKKDVFDNVIIIMFSLFVCSYSHAATIGVAAGNASILNVTGTTYVNGSIIINGVASVRLGYFPYMCNNNSSMTYGYARNFLLISKGLSVDQYISNGGQRYKYTVAAVTGNINNLSLDYILKSETITWGRTDTVSCNGGEYYLGVGGQLPFTLRLLPDTALPGGKVYTVEIVSYGGQVFGISDAVLTRSLAEQSFYTSINQNLLGTLPRIQTNVQIPVPVNCSGRIGEHLSWGDIQYQKGYFEKNRETKILVTCNGTAKAKVSLTGTAASSVGMGLTSELSTTSSSKIGIWPKTVNVGNGITTISLYGHLYGNMTGAGVISGVHIISLSYE
ncbi:hypothetical protein NXD78_004523 [Salmonella enterica subsp. enterica serovar Newport]|nr:hypothetical protein [Salmonella enterica subsp. enterica serovar Newport]